MMLIIIITITIIIIIMYKKDTPKKYFKLQFLVDPCQRKINGLLEPRVYLNNLML